MNKDKNAIFLEHHRFKQMMTDDFMEYLKEKSDHLEQKGFSVQDALNQRVKEFEEKLEEFNGNLIENRRDLDNMGTQIEKEYCEFSKNRKRWKSDFVKQKMQVSMTMNQIENMVSDCMGQNEWNSKAITNILDA